MRIPPGGVGFLLLVLSFAFAQPTSGVLPPHARRSLNSGNGPPRNLQVVAEEASDTDVVATATNEPHAEQALRQQLLSNYDRGSFPFVTLWENQNGTRTGLPVELGLNFHRVLQVDPTSSVVDMIVWVRQRWNDPRLAWDPEQHNGIYKVNFWVADGSGPGGETSEIWTPDLELWNNAEPLAQTLVSTSAVVSSDGTEFDLGTVECEEHVYPPFVNAPLEDWPVVFYHISFQRSWQPYARGFVTLQIILNVFAFTCFWLPPHLGERMSLSITAVLAAVASELVVAAKLPAAAELTWFAKFSTVSMLFTALALIESAAVIYFYYLTVDDLVPSWYRWLERNILRKESTKPANSDEFEIEFEDAQETDETQPTDQENGHPADQEKDHQTDSIEANGRTPSLRNSVMFEEPPPRPSRLGSKVTLDSTSDEAPHEHRMSMTLARELSSFRTRKSIKTILGRDADDFKNSKEMANNHKWQQVAKKMDEASRLIFPVLFAIFVTTAFATANGVESQKMECVSRETNDDDCPS
eukprot:scaffold34916_cov170-Amphora_coffeaeformis.AAC.5